MGEEDRLRDTSKRHDELAEEHWEACGKHEAHVELLSSNEAHLQKQITELTEAQEQSEMTAKADTVKLQQTLTEVKEANEEEIALWRKKTTEESEGIGAEAA